MVPRQRSDQARKECWACLGIGPPGIVRVTTKNSYESVGERMSTRTDTVASRQEVFSTQGVVRRVVVVS